MQESMLDYSTLPENLDQLLIDIVDGLLGLNLDYFVLLLEVFDHEHGLIVESLESLLQNIDIVIASLANLSTF